MPKTPFGNFLLGFKVVSIYLGYTIGGCLILYSISIGILIPLFMGLLIIFLAHEISKSILKEVAAEEVAPKDDDKDKDDDDWQGPICPV